MKFVFPGLLILLMDGDQQPKGGTEGTVVTTSPFEFRFRYAGARKAANGHARQGCARPNGPGVPADSSEVKIELIEDKKLKQPIVFDTRISCLAGELRNGRLLQDNVRHPGRGRHAHLPGGK